MRARVEKENKRKLAELRARLAQRRPRPARTQPMREPRYDEVYFEGIAALDELTGGSVPNLKGELVIDDSVWKSETRSKHADDDWRDLATFARMVAHATLGNSAEVSRLLGRVGR